MKLLVLLLFVPSVVSGWTVCIDPGHGGDDRGTHCQDGSNHEADLCWAIGIGLYDSLKTELQDSVYLTRLAFSKSSLGERAEIGQGQRADALGNTVGGNEYPPPG